MKRYSVFFVLLCITGSFLKAMDPISSFTSSTNEFDDREDRFNQLLNLLGEENECANLEHMVAQEENQWCITFVFKGKTILRYIADRYIENPSEHCQLASLFNTVLTYGKGECFNEHVQRVLAYLKKDREQCKDLIDIIYFQKPSIGENSSSSEESEESSDEVTTFTYAEPPSDSKWRVHKYQELITKLSSDNSLGKYEIEKMIKRYPWVLTERENGSGCTLIRAAAERWQVKKSSIRGMDGAIYRYTDNDGTIYCTTMSEALVSNETEIFECILTYGKDSEEFVNQLDDLFAFFMYHDDAIEILLEIVESNFPGRFQSYVYGQQKNDDRSMSAPVVASITPDKLSAAYGAQLFMAIKNGDNELSNASEMLKEHPTLIAASDVTGRSLLYYVVCLYDTINCAEKKINLKAFFAYLLLMGADPKQRTRRFQIQKQNYDLSIKEFPKKLIDSGENWPSVEDLLSSQAVVNPLGSLSQETKHEFSAILRTFEQNRETLLNDFHWIAEYIPEPELLDDMTGDEQAPYDEKEEVAQQKKSIWQSYKYPFKYLCAGLGCGIVGWWLYKKRLNNNDEDDLVRIMCLLHPVQV